MLSGSSQATSRQCPFLTVGVHIPLWSNSLLERLPADLQVRMDWNQGVPRLSSIPRGTPVLTGLQCARLAVSIIHYDSQRQVVPTHLASKTDPDGSFANEAISEHGTSESESVFPFKTAHCVDSPWNRVVSGNPRPSIPH